MQQRVWVIYLRPFNTAMLHACPQSASMSELWHTDPDEYDRQVAEPDERWAENDRRRLDARYYAHEEYDDNDLEGYDAEPPDNEDN